MSRFTVSVLMATALLGVLLWVVLSMARDFARAPAEPLPMPDSAVREEFDPTLARITSNSELKAWLTAITGSEASVSTGAADQLIDDYVWWLSSLGYSRFPPLLDADENYTDVDAELADLSDADLITRAGAGSSSAAQLLAERSLNSDPTAALEWYDQAIINGSVYAMLRVSDLLSTLGDPALAEFTSDPVWQQALTELNAQTPAPPIRALAWTLAAVYVGGYAIVDTAHANRINAQVAALDAAQTEQACVTAQEYVLDTASARRARGGAVFSTLRPRFALSVAQPEQVMPCDIAVPPLVDMNDCLTETMVGPEQKLQQAWFCPSP